MLVSLRRAFHRGPGILSWVLALVGCWGCAGRVDPVARLPHEKVSGEVYYDGLPLPSGLIHFRPLDFSRPPQILDITDGYFSGTIAAGRLHIDVTAMKPVPNKLGPSGEPVLERYVPPAVPLSAMIAIVKADGTEHVIDVDLESKPLPEQVLLDDPEAYTKLLRRNMAHRAERKAAREKMPRN